MLQQVSAIMKTVLSQIWYSYIIEIFWWAVQVQFNTSQTADDTDSWRCHKIPVCHAFNVWPNAPCNKLLVRCNILKGLYSLLSIQKRTMLYCYLWIYVWGQSHVVELVADGFGFDGLKYCSNCLRISQACKVKWRQVISIVWFQLSS